MLRQLPIKVSRASNNGSIMSLRIISRVGTKSNGDKKVSDFSNHTFSSRSNGGMRHNNNRLVTVQSQLRSKIKYSQSRNKTSLLSQRNTKMDVTNPSRVKSSLMSANTIPRNTRNSSVCINSTTVYTGPSFNSGRSGSAGSVPFSWSEYMNSILKYLRSSLLKPRTLALPRWISPRHLTYTLSEVCGHGSFILVAMAYAVDDYLMLRVTAVAGSTSMLFFTYFHPHGRVLWLPFRWNVMFIALNSYRIGHSLYERYMADLLLLDEDMLELKNNHLTLMEKSDFAKLVKLGSLEVLNGEDTMVHQGENNKYIRIIIDGDVDVFRDGVKTYTMTDGNFITEAGMHAGLDIEAGITSCCTIKPSSSTNQVRCLRWDRTQLVDLCRKDKTLYRSLQFALSWDIVRKLKSQRKFLINNHVEDPELWTIKRTEQSDSRYMSILQNILEHHGHLDGHRNEIAKYRSIHQIDDEHHYRALNNCGWTLEEYNLGRKKDEDETFSNNSGILRRITAVLVR